MSIAASTSALPNRPRGEALQADRTEAHLVRLPGTNWNLWRTFAVRGAGFAAEMIRQLEAAKAAAAADEYLRMRARAWRQTSAGLRQLQGELQGSSEGRAQLRKLRAAILAGKVEEVKERVEAVAAAEAWAEAEKAHVAFVTAYEADEEAVEQRLAGLSRDPRFREAMLWQNLASTRRISHELRPEARRRRRVPALKQIAMRVQRYCVKNDSIGFFGPVGWGWIGEGLERMEVRPGRELVEHREVFFEGWSIDALAASLEEENGEELKPWLAPRVKAGVWMDGLWAYQPQRKEMLLSEEEAGVLRQCDGRRTAREVAAALRKEGGGGEREVFALLEKLVRAGLIVWRLEVAPQLYPERELRERLERIGEKGLRERCVRALEELVEARVAVARAAGKAEELEQELEGLEKSFTRLTGESATRRGGQTYAGRTLVYEDCRRDCEVEIGSRLLEDLAQPLGILFDAARWATAEVGRVMREKMRACWAELKQEERGEIDCHLFSEYVISTVWAPGKRCTIFDEAVERFQEMWVRVLGRPSQSSSGGLAYPVEEVRGRAAGIFSAGEAGWSLGRYVSPDLMIAAGSVEAIRRGDYLGILGEIHSGNSIATFQRLHSNMNELLQATNGDSRDETVVMRQRPRSMWIARMDNAFVLPRYWRYQFGDDPPNHPQCRPLPAGMLVAKDTGFSVEVQARDGSIRFDALELFAGPLLDGATLLLSEFRPRLAHMPRLTLGKLVIAREEWNVTAKDMEFLRETDRTQQFLEVRAWGRSLGMPRRVFVKSPVERKPWLLDFDSPMLTAIFVAQMQKLDGEPMKVMEMMPDLNDLWLVDGEGQRFTSELRLVARHDSSLPPR